MGAGTVSMVRLLERVSSSIPRAAQNCPDKAKCDDAPARPRQPVAPAGVQAGAMVDGYLVSQSHRPAFESGPVGNCHVPRRSDFNSQMLQKCVRCSFLGALPVFKLPIP